MLNNPRDFTSSYLRNMWVIWRDLCKLGNSGEENEAFHSSSDIFITDEIFNHFWFESTGRRDGYCGVPSPLTKSNIILWERKHNTESFIRSAYFATVMAFMFYAQHTIINSAHSLRVKSHSHTQIITSLPNSTLCHGVTIRVKSMCLKKIK